MNGVVHGRDVRVVAYRLQVQRQRLLSELLLVDGREHAVRNWGGDVVQGAVVEPGSKEVDRLDALGGNADRAPVPRLWTNIDR